MVALSVIREWNELKTGNGFKHLFFFLTLHLRWLNTVSSTYIWIGRYNHSLSLGATIMVSKNCSIIGEHVVIIFLTQWGMTS